MYLKQNVQTVAPGQPIQYTFEAPFHHMFPNVNLVLLTFPVSRMKSLLHDYNSLLKELIGFPSAQFEIILSQQFLVLNHDKEHYDNANFQAREKASIWDPVHHHHHHSLPCLGHLDSKTIRHYQNCLSPRSVHKDITSPQKNNDQQAQTMMFFGPNTEAVLFLLHHVLYKLDALRHRFNLVISSLKYYISALAGQPICLYELCHVLEMDLDEFYRFIKQICIPYVFGINLDIITVNTTQHRSNDLTVNKPFIDHAFELVYGTILTSYSLRAAPIPEDVVCHDVYFVSLAEELYKIFKTQFELLLSQQSFQNRNNDDLVRLVLF
jgi:hypothetical protein